ncbi:hypothetical protein AB3S75_046086 [Citrus x aurantiifolia]
MLTTPSAFVESLKEPAALRERNQSKADTKRFGGCMRNCRVSLLLSIFAFWVFVSHYSIEITKEKEKSFFLVEEKRACSHKQDKHRHRDKHRTEAEREREGREGRQAGKSKLLNFVKTVIVNK